MKWSRAQTKILCHHFYPHILYIVNFDGGDPSGSPSKSGMAVISDRNYNVWARDPLGIPQFFSFNTATPLVQKSRGILIISYLLCFQMDWKRARRPITITKYTFPFLAIIVTGTNYRERWEVTEAVLETPTVVDLTTESASVRASAVDHSGSTTCWSQFGVSVFLGCTLWVYTFHVLAILCARLISQKVKLSQGSTQHE